MKISEIVKILEEEKSKRGDVEVIFWGVYGAASDEFEPMTDPYVPEDDRLKLNIWTVFTPDEETKMTPEQFFAGYEDKIPEHTKAGLWNYLNHGIEPGSFMMAVLENNLLRVVGYADDDSIRSLKPIIQLIYSRAPAGCYGSKAAIRDHMRAARANAGILWASYKEPASSGFVKGL